MSATLSTHLLTRCNDNLPPFQTRMAISDVPPLAKETIDSLQTALQSFNQIPSALYAKKPKPSFDLSPDTLAKVIAIARYLKNQPAIQQHPNDPQRFKISGLCSLTIDPSNLFIHCKKKKKNSHLLGYGSFSSYHVCVRVTNEKEISLEAEGTFYVSWKEDNEILNREVPKPPNPKLSNIKNSVVLPSQSYTYTTTKPPEASLTKKYCRIFPLFHTDLHEALAWYENNLSVPPETLWKVLQQAIGCCLDLHKQNLAHRDIKPENYLVRFPTHENGVDWNNPKIALGDLDIVIEKEKTNCDWKGTDAFWPKETTAMSTKQSDSADVYALGRLIKKCLKAFKPSPQDKEFLKTLVKYTAQYKNNPSAEELDKRIRDYLLQNPLLVKSLGE